MITQRTTEWFEAANSSYHERQFKEVYRSTIYFCNWLEEMGCLSDSTALKILDIGSGMGSNIFYMSERYPNSSFEGIDINPDMVERGNQIFVRNHRQNSRLIQADLYQLAKSFIGKYDGIVSFQTLSWLPDYKESLEKFTELEANWIAITSLFHEGDINCSIQVQDYTRPSDDKLYSEYYNNVYSLKRVQKYFELFGYNNFIYIPFDIDIDIPKSNGEGMGTYTERLENGRRLQISGPLLMPWYFILVRRV
jgi:SAM-dependent methyltransferase